MLDKELFTLKSLGPTAVALGVFDGVHLGHQHLISRLVTVAMDNRVTPVVITFSNHPLTVLRPDVALSMLSTLDARIEFIRNLGIAQVVPIPFTRDLSILTPEEFISKLRDNLHITHLVVGPDFAMGYNRAGTIDVLQRLGNTHGFSVEIVPPYSFEGELVSSTRIRAGLRTGNVSLVSKYMGRFYDLKSTVIHGEGRGVDLGFPTANLESIPQMAMPADGVYATWLYVDNYRLQSATSIGVKPTFHQDAPQEIEVHALDLPDELLDGGGLYGRVVRIEFFERIRGQERFDNIEALIIQMRKDVSQVREMLSVPSTQKNQ
jgi:riboflavin kinase/FMN adenylyltransferase